MKEYIQNYEKWLKEILKQELNNDEANKLANYHKTQIQFLQHERFVHLIVMVMTQIVDKKHFLKFEKMLFVIKFKIKE